MKLNKFLDCYFGLSDDAFVSCCGDCLNTNSVLPNCSEFCCFWKDELNGCLIQELLKVAEQIAEEERKWGVDSSRK